MADVAVPEREAIVRSAQTMLHREKVKGKWWHRAYNCAARACEDYLAEGASEAQKAAAFLELKNNLAEITGLPRAH